MKQETLKMLESKARNIRNGKMRNSLVPARKIRLLSLEAKLTFLTPGASCSALPLLIRYILHETVDR